MYIFARVLLHSWFYWWTSSFLYKYCFKCIITTDLVMIVLIVCYLGDVLSWCNHWISMAELPSTSSSGMSFIQTVVLQTVVLQKYLFACPLVNCFYINYDNVLIVLRVGSCGWVLGPRDYILNLILKKLKLTVRKKIKLMCIIISHSRRWRSTYPEQKWYGWPETRDILWWEDWHPGWW